ncbi:hypothetical protein [Maliponia aquimaris]|uniref:Regulator of nucleoside diphosphate kinase n=1 Tax=Maliponia aquimaris TaxID=1673631 RepID=A0A238L1T9_9RHOB|nr:hypothetical protein [Maliponia aquimaris]SMX48781.1 hypothetical protein MAA8898_04090 [Maliponia aquimaris]
MTRIHETDTAATLNQSGPRTRPRIRAVLPETDHQLLQRHLEQCEQLRLPGWTLLAYVLHHKIMNTEPVADFHAGDLVTGGCEVSYSVNGGPGQKGLMSHRTRSGFGGGVIPVASLLGATLIGMRVGQRAPLLREDGEILSLSVLDVTPPN